MRDVSHGSAILAEMAWGVGATQWVVAPLCFALVCLAAACPDCRFVRTLMYRERCGRGAAPACVLMSGSKR